MPIVSSTLTTEHPQANGQYWVHEVHVGSDGKTYNCDYLATPPQDVEQVMALRAENMSAEIDAHALAAAEAVNFELPISKYAFRQRFTVEERFVMDEFNATFELKTTITAEQKAMIRSGLEDFKAAEYVHLSLAMPMLQLYEALGLIAPGRAAEIGTP